MGEIILGSKRAPRSRRIVRRGAVAALVASIVAAIGWTLFQRATRYAVPGGKVPSGALVAEHGRLVLAGAGSASLERRGGLWVLRLAGDPYARGASAGRLFGARALADGVLDVAVAGEDPPAGWLAGNRHDARLRWRYRLLADGIPAPRRQELAGLVAGLRASGVPGAPSYQRLIRRQAALDVGRVPGADAPGGVAAGLAFAMRGDRVLLGRAFGLPGAGPAGDPVVSFVRPPGGIPFASVGWAGQVGVVTGVNAEGVAIAMNPMVADDVRATAAAEPVALLTRDVLEKARSIDEAIAILKGATPLGAASWLIVDGRPAAAAASRWAVVERSPGRFTVLRPEAPPVIGDLLAAPEFAKDPENDRARRTRAGLARADRLSDLLAAVADGDAPAAAALLRDRSARGGAGLPLGNGNAIDDLDAAHVAILDPGGLTLWVNEGPGAAGAFHTWDLRQELLDEPPRAGAPPAIPADPSVDAGAARALALARGELRAAQHLRRLGRRAAAAEAAARAISFAPDFPPPYKLAADLAQTSGDEVNARTLYRRFLELTPADPNDIQDARAALGVP